MSETERARWTRLVADFEASELTQREFAVERGISFSNLRNWIYRLRRESRPLGLETAERSSQGPERETREEGSRLVPVRVVASAPKARRAQSEAAVLELALPSGTRLRFAVGTDLGYLRALTAALSL